MNDTENEEKSTQWRFLFREECKKLKQKIWNQYLYFENASLK